MKKFFPILEKCPLFDGVQSGDLAGILGCLGGKVVPIRKGQAVLREGDTTVFVGIVLEGSVQLLREDPYGNRSVLTHIGPTQLFGEAYAFSGIQALPISVVPAEDGHILLLDSRRIAARCTNACDFHNKVIYNLLRLVANKNLLLHEKIDATSRRTTREKLMAYLLNQAKLQGSNSFTIPFDRQALADYLGVDRSGLSSEIGKLRKEAILECEKSHFRLLRKYES